MVLMVLLFILIVGYLTVLLPEFRQAGMNLSTLNLRLNTFWIITGCALPIISCSLSFWWFTKQQWTMRMRLLMRCPILGPLLRLSIEYYISLQLGLLISSGCSWRLSWSEFAQIHKMNCFHIGDKAWQALSNGEDIRDFVLSVDLLPKECALLFNLSTHNNKLVKISKY